MNYIEIKEWLLGRMAEFDGRTEFEMFTAIQDEQAARSIAGDLSSNINSIDGASVRFYAQQGYLGWIVFADVPR
jgi:hypothetical protein